MRYEFGDFVLDVSRRVLLRSGEPVALAPKALELLIALVERPAAVLSKREILARVWPDTFVEEANVAQNISLLRKAVGDLIVTIPRSGYRFGGTVRAAADFGDRQAFHDYIRGRHYWNKRTRADLERAFEYATKAAEADPAYARAQLGLADTYNLLGAQHAMVAPRTAFPRARAAALRALEIDENCGEAYASLAFVNCWFDWDHAEAERNFRRAIELKPAYATSYHWWAEALASAGRFDDSFARFETAIKLDPLSSAIRTDFGVALSLAGDYARAEAVMGEVLRFDPAFARAWIGLAMHHDRKHEYARALECVRHALEHDPSPSSIALEARLLALQGRRSDARENLRQLETLAKTVYVVSCDLATVYASLGESQRAGELLEAALAGREPHLTWLAVDSRYFSFHIPHSFMAGS